MKPILVCEPFSFEIQDIAYSSSGFTVYEKDLYHINSDAEFFCQNILFLLAGLHLERKLTKPGEYRNLERKLVETNIKDLSFLKLDGDELYTMSRAERAKKIGYIYEDPDIAIFGRTVKDEFFYSFSIVNRVPNSTDLIRYGLYEILDRKTEVLSGGEKHRLICASAFERKPKLIIADFSSSNLDRDFFLSLLTWIKDFLNLGGAAILHGLSTDELKLIKSDVKLLYGNKGGKITSNSSTNMQFLTNEEMKIDFNNMITYRDIGDIVLEVEDVYIENRTKPFSFELKENEIVIIEGKNGAGKSTLGKIIAGQIKKHKGTITKAKKPFLIGLSLQFPERTFLNWTIWDELPDENLLIACEIEKESWKNHPRSLCRSKQKLLSIACALKHSNPLAILDEPTAGLDYYNKVLFIKLLNYFSNRSIIIFNHDCSISGLFRTTIYHS